ncbi:MAG: Gfo/Idh/MocA family protein [Pseudonocardia sp.]
MTATLQHTGRIGLIGTGGIGRAHAQAAAGLTGGFLAGVADIDAAAAAAVGAEHDVPALPVEALADAARFDLVVVASPPSTHLAVVEPLLRAGVPVMCEKPLAVDLATARKIAELAAETGTPLTMATKFRFVDDVALTRELIAGGALGDVLKVEVAFAGRVEMAGRWNADPAVAGGGVAIDNATHGVDLVRHLVGELVEVASVHGRVGQPLQVEDSATLLARTADGVLAQVDVTWSFRRLSPVYCAVYGTAGSVEIGWSGARAVTAENPTPHEFGSGYRKIDSLRANLEAVLAALAVGEAPPVTPADAVAAAAVVEAGYVAATCGTWLRVEGAR